MRRGSTLFLVTVLATPVVFGQDLLAPPDPEATEIPI
jgi:hypothetical protein